MGEYRLNSSALLHIEADLTKTINFKDSIEPFVSQT